LKLESVIVLVPADTVRPVDVTSQTDPFGLLMLTAEDPRVIDRVNVPKLLKPAAVTAKFPVLKSPLLTLRVKVPVVNPTVRELPSVHPPPTPSKVMHSLLPPPRATPLVVTTFPVVLAQKITSEIEDQTTLDETGSRVRLP
jgi:hypothetical protein